jgi:hypothetical protein
MNRVFQSPYFRDSRRVNNIVIYGNTANQTLVPPINNQYTDIYNLVISNDSLINTDVWLSDGTQNYVVHVPAQSSGGFSFNTQSAIPATNLNTPWTINTNADTNWAPVGTVAFSNTSNVNICVSYTVNNN